MNTWKQKSQPAQAGLTSGPSANLTRERSPAAQHLQEAAAGEQSRPLELDRQMRGRMERQFGLDFSAVRLVESDLPGKLGADAIAQGNLIRFAPGAFHPETAQGEQLLSHELSHVVQQSRGIPGGRAGLPLHDAALERGADVMAARAMSGEPAAGPARAFSPVPAASAPMLCGKTKTRSVLNMPFDLETRDFAGGQGRLPTLSPQSYRRERRKPNWQKYYKKRAAWENRNQFNLQKNNYKLRRTLTKIDNATNAAQAQKALNELLKNKIGGKIGGDKSAKLNLRSVKLRLKGIARMMAEFPQLDGQISMFDDVGRVTEEKKNTDKDSGTTEMAVFFDTPTSAKDKIQRVMGWSASPGSYLYGNTDEVNPKKIFNPFYQKRREIRLRHRASRWSIASGRWTGTHELGHVLQYMLDDQLTNSSFGDKGDPICSDTKKFGKYYDLIYYSHLTAASVVQQAISELLTDQSLDSSAKTKLRDNVRRYTGKGDGINKDLPEEEAWKELSKDIDLLDYSALSNNLSKTYISQNPRIMDIWKQKAEVNKVFLNDLYEMGLTSKYGATGIAEVFAEAFADYNEKGEKANPLSKKIVAFVKAQTALGEPTGQQGAWVDEQRAKASKILADLPRLKPMSIYEFNRKLSRK